MKQSKQTSKLVKQLKQQAQEQEVGRQRVLAIVKERIENLNNK
jgi:hypothetical protein